MIECGGVWLPDGEQHLVDWMVKRNEVVDGFLTYQHHKLRKALSLTPDRRLAVDVGAHCGLWSMWLGREFDSVLAFEPVQAHVNCFMLNCVGLTNVSIYQHALGDREGRIHMRTDPSSSGDTYPAPGVAEGDTAVKRYDDLGLLGPVSLVKLDCEGYELYALRGMVEMLQRDHPTVVVEQKPGKASKYGLKDTQAVSYLEQLGARQVAHMAGDYIMKWDV